MFINLPVLGSNRVKSESNLRLASMFASAIANTFIAWANLY